MNDQYGQADAAERIPPVWSPDGQQIAFVSSGADTQQGIYVLSIAGEPLQ